MEFPKDEVKNKVVWTKGADITDGSPRYTFEGRDPATTYERFQVVIYPQRKPRSRVQVHKNCLIWRQADCSVADRCLN